MKKQRITSWTVVALFLASILCLGVNITTVQAASGYLGWYYNLDGPMDPNPHPDMETPITGVKTGFVDSTLPLTLTPFGATYINNLNWYDAQYLSFSRVDADLKFGTSDWFPVNEGKPGDPYYFAVHWEATITVSLSGSYSFDIGSDDDAWVFIDSSLVFDYGGIHGITLPLPSGSVTLIAGVHSLDIYFAERHTVQSAFWFEFTTPGVVVKPPHIIEGSLFSSVIGILPITILAGALVVHRRRK